MSIVGNGPIPLNSNLPANLPPQYSYVTIPSSITEFLVVRNPIVAGNASTSMSTTGASSISGVAGQDDAFGYIPTTANFDFFFFGTNYGRGSNTPNSIYYNTNNVIGFGNGDGTISWAANTGRGILFGNSDRRCNPDGWYFPVTTSNNYRILRCLIFFQNVYSAGTAGEGQLAIRFVRDLTGTSNQYVEFRIFKGSGGANGGQITNTGAWNLTNGVSFQNTYGTIFNATFPADNTSYVLRSDGNGSNWTFFSTSYLNI